LLILSIKIIQNLKPRINSGHQSLRTSDFSKVPEKHRPNHSAGNIEIDI